MNITLTLVLGLLLLAPGLAAFVGFFAPRTHPFQASPPPPSSFAALSFVILGSLAAHAATAIIFAINDGLAGLPGVGISVAGWGNVYPLLLASVSQAPGWTTTSATVFLITLSVLSAITCAISYAAGSKAVWDERFGSLLFGWAKPLLDQLAADPADNVLTAYVVTDLEADGYWVGYEGIVDDLAMDHTKAIERIVLTDCTAFHLKPNKRGMARVVIKRANPIPQLYLDRSQIKNVAFNVIAIT